MNTVPPEAGADHGAARWSARGRLFKSLDGVAGEKLR